MTRRVLALAAASAVIAAQPALPAGPTARAAGPWTDENYVPRAGHWRPYVLAPPDRDVAPRTVLAARPRAGGIAGDPALALRADGRSVRLTNVGARTGSPLLSLDFGKEVAGKVRVRLSGASSPAPALHACFSESRKYMASGTRNDGQAAHAPGCDTANIWNGFPSVPYTADTDSHLLQLPDRLPATVTDTQRRGGFRFLTLFLDGPGSVDVDAVSLDFTAAPLQRRPADYAGSFLSSDHLLNRIWYAGAYTVQINTDLPTTAKRWPYEPGERDHADARVPHAEPGKEVIFDGGKRDRIVWQGDLAVQNPVTYVSTADLDAVENSLSSLAAQQEPDGFVPAASQVGPHNAGEKRNYGEYVTWFVSNMALHHRWTGDRAYLDRWYPALEKAVAWLESVRARDDRGLIAFGAVGSCGHYGYSDCGHETYINALYKRNLDQMAELASARGDDEGAARYRTRAATVARAINEQLWDADAGAYRLSRELPEVYPQDGNAAAVLAGVAQGERARRALAQVRARNWSRLGSLTVDPDATNAALPPFYAPLPSSLEVDARLGASDPRGLGDQTALDLVRRFWGHQLEQDPQSTFFEHLRPDGTPNLSQFSSLAHGWAAGPTVSLTTHVLGVTPTAPGFDRFAVAPHPGDLRWAEGTVPTPRGEIRTEWRRDGDEAFALEVTVPKGTRARAAVPTFGREVEVRVDGRPHGATVIDDLGPGRHRITTRAVDRPPDTALQLAATPRITRTEPGEIVALRLGLTGAAQRDLTGDVRITAPEGWTVSPERPRFDLRSDGRPASTELRVYAAVPEDAPSGEHRLRFEAVTQDGTRAQATATVALKTTRSLFDFESGTQGWRPGTNVERVERVTSFANGPGRPVQGEGALDATASAVPGSAPKSVTVAPEQPLDLSAAREVHAQLDCYGGLPGASGYEAFMTLRSGDQTLSRTFPINCDRWNLLTIDVTGWPERRAVTGIEVGFRALGADQIWLPHFQIDDVGYSG